MQRGRDLQRKKLLILALLGLAELIWEFRGITFYTATGKDGK
jgi:hypothetical protein